MRYIKEFYRFLKHIAKSRRLLKTLIINDFKKQYLGSYLGLFWAFAQPLTYLMVIWFVFTYGFKAAPKTDGTPFFLWLSTGMIAWLFFSNSFTSSTNSILEYSFLVKKVSFRTSILPLVKIGSGLIIHISLICLLVVVYLLYGYKFSIYWLQVFYYVACSVYLLLGLSWLTSSIRVFVKDVGSFVGVMLQIGFWATPIFWSMDLIPQRYQYIIKINPAYYLVEGFRDTFIYHIWFWQKGFDTLLFFGISSVFFISGAIVFRRLRPHFGDIL
jgi:lipopolysaccharide transport system permease protein/teichoic acid transport system permease protein